MPDWQSENQAVAMYSIGIGTQLFNVAYRIRSIMFKQSRIMDAT